ncbi:MAG: DUF4124 domain-containing protein [Burkholderiales bacterium]
MVLKIMIAGGMLAAALALPAGAQVLYKSTLPDGRVVYGDKPDPTAVKSEPIKPDTAKIGVVPPTSRETATLNELERARLKREGGDSTVRTAEEALKKAEAAREAGKEPLPGERVGTAGGASRLTDDYWKRQKKLEEAVETARRNVGQASSGK